MSKLQIYFVGDELISGFGDARAMGWVGRLMARTVTEPPLCHTSLPFAGETTQELDKRWPAEVLPRLDREADNRLVVGLGSHDLDAGQSLARSRLHAANLLDNAMRYELRPFVVGPPPRPDMPPAIQAGLTAAFAEVCERREIPFVDTYNPLVNHDQWLTDMSISGGYAPRQAGYGLITWLVLHKGWHNWLGVTPS
ncbi:MAG: GDSL-type esterase/lipase family protein [Trueperella sp.]|nr:GDSL-type esterase/lipase family protein [Trueperella sp.]